MIQLVYSVMEEWLRIVLFLVDKFILISPISPRLFHFHQDYTYFKKLRNYFPIMNSLLLSLKCHNKLITCLKFKCLKHSIKI